MAKLTQEEQEIRQANISKNLRIQADGILRNSVERSYKTNARYKQAMHRFADFLSEHYSLKNIKNVEARHIYAYVSYLQDEDKTPNYIYTDLSAIRCVQTLSGSKNRLPTNKMLNLDPREKYKFDRAFMTNKFDLLIKVAIEMKRQDVILVAYIARYFGLRLEEAVTLRIFQIEDAIKYKQLHITNGKGGQERDIPVETKLQEKILERLIVYAKQNGKHSSQFLVCDDHKHSVKREKAALQNWMCNHRKKFTDQNRTQKVADGKKPKIANPSWHGLRHLYYQEAKEHLKLLGKMSKSEMERELSERLGHHRNDVNKYYSNDEEDS